VSGLPSGGFVERVLAHGLDVTDGGLVVESDMTGLEVWITTMPTVLTGGVLDDKGQPAGGHVIVFAADAALWTKPGGRFVRIASATALTGFRVEGLPPGNYLVLALAERDELEWASPENLERLRPSASAVTLTKGQTLTLTLVRKQVSVQ
jgi:hypothetical protein